MRCCCYRGRSCAVYTHPGVGVGGAGISASPTWWGNDHVITRPRKGAVPRCRDCSTGRQVEFDSVDDDPIGGAILNAEFSAPATSPR